MVRATVVALIIMILAAIASARPGQAQDGQLEPNVASLVQLINAHDVEALVERVAFVPQPCITEAREGLDPGPYCPEGIRAGTTVDTFLTAACEGSYVVGSEGAHRAIDGGLSPDVRVLDVLAGGPPVYERPQVRYTIISSRSPTEQGHIWYATSDGMLDALLSTCSLTAEETANSGLQRGATSLLRGVTGPSTGFGPSGGGVEGLHIVVAAIAAAVAGALVAGAGVLRRRGAAEFGGC